MKLYRNALVPVLAGILLLSSTSTASAWSINIWGNGAGSKNKVNVSSIKATSLQQSNNVSSNNVVVVNQSTGGNKIKGNTGGSSTVVTGDTYSSVKITTTGGYNYAHVDTCCDHGECQPTPTPTEAPTPTPTPTEAPTPTPTPTCEEETIWGQAVESANQGTLKDDSAITDPERTDANDALGSPDGAFFSLGKGGSMVIEFASPVANVEGDDLSFHEITNGRDTYPEEKAMVAVWDGDSWEHLGEVSNQAGGDGVAYLDLETIGLDQTSMVRLTDSTDYSPHNNEADGYDVDAVDGVTLVCSEYGQD